MMRISILHEAKVEPLPIIANIAHSGTYVPPEIDKLFTSRHRGWLRNTDWYLPQVFGFLPDLGITVLEATHSRYVVDLNRDPDGELFGGLSRSLIAAHNQGDPVYSLQPESSELESRLGKFHTPYHFILEEAIARSVKRFGRVLLLDLHSFMGPGEMDICIGDGLGVTCSAGVAGFVEESLASEGFDVARNNPFRGGYIVRSNARAPVVEALQVELRYPTYISCAKIDQPGRPPFEASRIEAVQLKLKPAIKRVIQRLTHDWLPQANTEE